VVHVDDLSRQLQDGGCPHFLDTLDAPWRQPTDSLVAALIAWTERLHPLIVEAAGRLAGPGGVVEGEGIDPRIGWGGIDVRAVYVIELDRPVLWGTFATRASGPRFRALTAAGTGHGCGTRRPRRGRPACGSRPWATLAGRATDAVSGGGRGPVRR
jgi:hypothetical protein